MTKNERIHEMLGDIGDMLSDLALDNMTPTHISRAIDTIHDKVGDVDVMLDQPNVSEHPSYAVLVQLPNQTRILRHDGRTTFTHNEAEVHAASVNWDTSEHMVGQIVMTYESTISDSELREEYQ